jgi:predicted nucleic acid-binding protein
MKILLDTNVLAKVCHPADKYRDAQEWFRALVTASPANHEILVSAISLYELERGLIRSRATQSLDHFRRIRPHLRWLPLTAEIAGEAVDLWAQQASDPHSQRVSDADWLIAAQAHHERAVLITSDASLIALGPSIGLDVRDWVDFDPTSK